MKVAVFGGCCSADVFYLDVGKKLSLEMVGYYARSSLVSAFSEPPVFGQKLDFNVVSSSFQRKMLWRDIEKTLLDDLFFSTDSGDCLLMDFLVERLELAEFSSGSLITFSSEAKKLFKNNDVIPKRVIKEMSNEKKELFKSAWNVFFRRCVANGVEGKLVLNKIYLTKSINDGSSFSESQLLRIDKRNEFLDYIYNVVEEDIRPSRVISYPDDVLIADVKHKWGLSPFHFINKFYEFQAKKLASIVE
ncbi:DUF6270 domain-containing protein [Halomonas sp. AOP42-A1-14]|uniref:DUF6270 domain-containing protein n=1 Tax=Halomonas sp. AOP42-A1-14 TaxID=3457676 RepID=UPI004033C7D4